MISTFQALVVALVFMLPGALYTWDFERTLGDWGLSAADRLLRFTGSSAVFHALLAPVTWWFYREQIVTGRLAEGHASWWLWPAVLAYTALPTAAGRIVALATRRGDAWSRLVTGGAPAPRAWDHVFSSRRPAWLRIRLKETEPGEECWVFGSYTTPDDRLGAYAAGYGQERDLYLADTAWLEAGTGDPLREPDGRPRMRGVGLLIGWDQIAYIEVIWG
ncbi:DUF6338 family protein [Streptomyces specialis]|uniref:DUF6338 family protein n=1 Tax=Streptomyces specialis TaxID=498367 RepID=UPI000AF4C814|nr:DUF6338 family protein [Streptomyces specialis]